MALDQGLANWRFCFAALWFLSQGLRLPCAAPGVAAQTAAPGGPTKVGRTLIKLIFSFHIFTRHGIVWLYLPHNQSNI